ncbi:MAG: ribosome silencing factor [Gammaproteobacteria bacterium]|nr:ribosome silencing factor [Gammaproteobacteria bacterium]
MQTEKLLKHITHSLEDNKAIETITLNVQPLTDIMDAIVICTATSTRHSTALANNLLEYLREFEIKPMGTEGSDEAQWILLDFYDVVVHIMLSDVRDFYALEKLWAVSEPKQAERS